MSLQPLGFAIHAYEIAMTNAVEPLRRIGWLECRWLSNIIRINSCSLVNSISLSFQAASVSASGAIVRQHHPHLRLLVWAQKEIIPLIAKTNWVFYLVRPRYGGHQKRASLNTGVRASLIGPSTLFFWLPETPSSSLLVVSDSRSPVSIKSRSLDV